MYNMTKKEILDYFNELSYETHAFEGWLSSKGHSQVLDRLLRIDDDPLTKVQLNQLLVLSLDAGVSDGFFKYYWLENPAEHTYDVMKIEDYSDSFLGQTNIISLQHLRWGLKRVYTDSLLYFGSIRNAYSFLRSKSSEELASFYKSKRFKTEEIKKRGRALPLQQISKDDRYLISEMACKSYDLDAKGESEIQKILMEAYKDFVARNRGAKVKVIDLLKGDFLTTNYGQKQYSLEFSADEILDVEIESEADLNAKIGNIASAFSGARERALRNTEYYLSMVNDLDVYVATSMRTRKDFRKMSDTCTTIFEDSRLKHLDLRYFDPTLSAADGHEDKGLIECLMVKCAKALIYSAGEKESYGKDAEAAMALSLGKPVIFFCDEGQRKNFYKEVHPLSRLINFQTGVAVGCLVTDKVTEVSELLYRIFENKMEFVIEQPKPGYFRLKDKLTGSVVRVQTNYSLLREAFWNYYHMKDGI
jgi:hypothetical protein